MISHIDVVIPCYGDVDLLRQSVTSVLAQTDPSWRLTLLDDCMPGNPLERWSQELADSRVRYQRNERNLGINANFTQALDCASGEYVVIMGADDMMLPNYVATVRRSIARYPSATVIQPGVEVIDAEGRSASTPTDLVKRLCRPSVDTPTVLTGEMLAASLLNGNWTYFPSLCWRREPIRRLGFRQGLSVALDLALLLDMLLDGGSLLLDPTTTFQYRRHRASYSSTLALTGGRFEEERRVFARASAACRSHGWPRAARSARLHLTSRLHAASLVPTAAKAREVGTGLRLLRHVLAV